ncbi:TPA: ead/Ea22-like family protein [Citrobacter koseri]|nr:ead/Ea22-like family protein [Citrobacter koseri]
MKPTLTAELRGELHKLATDAHELGIIKRYSKGIEANKRFAATATPLTVLALLDELEAKEKHIAELEARTVKLPYLPDDCDRTEAHFKYQAALSAAGISLQKGDE